MSKINVPFQFLCVAHTCADSSDVMETMTASGLFTSGECRERIWRVNFRNLGMLTAQLVRKERKEGGEEGKE